MKLLKHLRKSILKAWPTAGSRFFQKAPSYLFDKVLHLLLEVAHICMWWVQKHHNVKTYSFFGSNNNNIASILEFCGSFTKIWDYPEWCDRL